MGALVLRGVMIVAGSALVSRFSWTLYIFGAFLVITGIRMAIQKDDVAYDPEKDPILRLARRVLPVTREYHGSSFFVDEADATGKLRRKVTPLFIVLLVVGTTDVTFAYLKLGLSLVLIFIGAKMILEPVFHVPIMASLGVVAAVLLASIVASLRWPRVNVTPGRDL